jgi:hypothetical protein
MAIAAKSVNENFFNDELNVIKIRENVPCESYSPGLFPEGTPSVRHELLVDQTESDESKDKKQKLIISSCFRLSDCSIV